MVIKKILIFLPLVIILFLLQSYFWVPTYDEQTRGNPERLSEYIEGSIGDASILNPILSSDNSSSQITGMVFEGLLDRDKDLNFRGRVSTSWEIFEEAYFYLNKKASIPGIGELDSKGILDLIENFRDKEVPSDSPLGRSLGNIKEMKIVPSDLSEKTVSINVPGQKDKREVRIKIYAPPRVKLVLAHVDQDLFHNLELILGKEYFASFPSSKYLTGLPPGISEDESAVYAQQFLPATEHNPVLLFNIRPDVKFHDGHILDAHDVKFTYNAIMNPKNLSPRIADYEPVKSVDVVDPLTVRITYKRLYSPAIGTWAMGILPEHLLNEKALRKEAVERGKDPESFSLRESLFNRHPVGSGPFVFKEWKSDQYIILQKFEDYWEMPPNYRRYIYRIIPDNLTQEMEFYAGTLDSYSVQPHQVERLKQDERFQNFSGLSFGYTYIGYNLRRKPFDDPRVRKALGMAIDVEKIIKYVLYNQGERITGPFVKQTDFYNHNIDPLPYDPEGALKLLSDAGWRPNNEGWLEKDGKKFQFTLITNNGNDLRKAILTIAQDAWKQIGIDVRTDLLEWSVFLQERVDKNDFDALILAWGMGIEPDLYQIWHSSQTNPHQLNFVGFKNRKADELIVKIRQEYDHKKQVEYCHSLHEIIAQQQPYTFLFVGRWTAVLDKRIVIKKTVPSGGFTYEKIKPTKTGDFRYDFIRWTKLPEVPTFNAE